MPDSLKDAIAALRAIPHDWGDDPLRELRIIRHGYDPQDSTQDTPDEARERLLTGTPVISQAPEPH